MSDTVSDCVCPNLTPVGMSERIFSSVYTNLGRPLVLSLSTSETRMSFCIFMKILNVSENLMPYKTEGRPVETWQQANDPQPLIRVSTWLVIVSPGQTPQTTAN